MASRWALSLESFCSVWHAAFVSAWTS